MPEWCYRATSLDWRAIRWIPDIASRLWNDEVAVMPEWFNRASSFSECEYWIPDIASRLWNDEVAVMPERFNRASRLSQSTIG